MLIMAYTRLNLSRWVSSGLIENKNNSDRLKLSLEKAKAEIVKVRFMVILKTLAGASIYWLVLLMISV